MPRKIECLLCEQPLGEVTGRIKTGIGYVCPDCAELLRRLKDKLERKNDLPPGLREIFRGC